MESERQNRINRRRWNKQQQPLLPALLRHLGADEVVILADVDEPGRRGAQLVALRSLCWSVCPIEPPPRIKDARAWLPAGGTRREVEGR
jgi:hypothetical protein